MTFTKQLLSASTNGKAINLATGSGPTVTGSLLHTSATGAGALDEVYLYASNWSTGDAVIFIQWGAVTTGDSFYNVVPAQQGRTLICDGRLACSGIKIYGLCSGVSGVAIDGYINNLA